MNHIYVAPKIALELGPIGAHAAYDYPDDLRLVIVEQWVSPDAQDRFEAFPGVVSLNPWDYAKLVPASVVAAFRNSPIARVSAGETIESALWKIRAQCPAARP